jgi:hypothetical protein
LNNLLWLYIGPSATNKNLIDLSNQTKLKFLAINWRKNIKGIGYCQELEDISLFDLTEKDLNFMEMLNSLRSIDIRTGSIANITGLEKSQNLESIFLGNCRKLTSISNLNKMMNLKKIVLDECPKVDDYEKLTELPMLEELDIMSCKKIQSINFINYFPQLKKMILSGDTEISDGDLAPIVNVKEVFYTNRKHYNIKFPPSNWRKF